MEIEFNPAGHTYTRNNKEYTPVSRAISKFKPLFPRNHIAKAIAKRDGVGPELILAQWQQKAAESCRRGNNIHKMLEDYEKEGTVPEGNLYYAEILRNFVNWKSTKKGKSTPEEIIYSDTYKVAGTVDLPMRQGKHIDIWDYKTNKELTNENKYNKFYRNGLEYIGDTKYQGYALQLSVYALLFQEQGLRPRHLGILWIDDKGMIHEIPVPFMYQEALHILKTHGSYN